MMTTEAVHLDVLHEGESKDQGKRHGEFYTKPFEQRGWHCHGGGKMRRNAQVNLQAHLPTHSFNRPVPHP